MSRRVAVSQSVLGMVLFVFLAVLTAPPSAAQWSSDPDANLAVAQKPGAQVQTKVVAREDGSVYVSWFDNDPDGSPSGGYDVYLQRLDALGNPLWPVGGILIADRGFSSTQDYGLDVDSAGNALLAFRDDRSGGIEITATRIDPDGNALWGPNGVQVTVSGAGPSAPKITGPSDGDIVVAWSEDSDIVLQRLDGDGNPLWGTGVVAQAPPNSSYSLADLHASDSGNVIASWVRSFGLGDRHLYAQKLDVDGLPLWGMNPLHVFESGSLQMGNFPSFVVDGHGGAAFGWYAIAPLRVLAQRILALGTEAFAHNGVLATTDTTREHTGPDLSFDAAERELFLVWTERNALSQQGIYAQKFDSAGARQWGDEAKPVRALGANETNNARCLQIGSGIEAYWLESTSFAQDKIYGTRLDGDGDPICTPFPVSSLVAGKSRLAAALTPSDMAVLAWSDNRNGDDDIYAQNVNPDCTLGNGGGVTPDEVSPPGAAQPLVFTDKTTLLWEEALASSSEWFNLYRGAISGLSSGDYGACLEADIPTNTTSDTELPSTGTGNEYLVTGENSAGEGPAGSASDGSPRTPVSCP